MLEAPIDDMFTIREIETPVPEKARIMKSEPCDGCGEPTMSSKLRDLDGEKLCGECFERNR